MKLLNVKSTIVHKLLDLVAPHYCCSCGEIGSIFCESCKYDIISEPFLGCLICGRLTSSSSCKWCRTDIRQSWCGGERIGGLEQLIDCFKFEYAESATSPIGDILLARLPNIPSETVVVPIPTIRAHVRQRGYDHTLLLSRYIAEKRSLQYSQCLGRVSQTIQRGTPRRVRLKQARAAFTVRGDVQPDVPYLLIDDVVTTGATLHYAAKTLKNAGAETIWAIAAARQPLD